MKLLKQIWILFFGYPKQTELLIALLPTLEQFRLDLLEDLQRLDSIPDTMPDIAGFFNKVSRMQDSSRLAEVLAELRSAHANAELIKQLDLLNQHIIGSGRDVYGYNRTVPGQVVTNDNVYLGNIYGLFTHPVTFWLTQKDEPKDGWEGTIWEAQLAGKNAYDVVASQARKFMSANGSAMVGLIDSIAEIATENT